MSRPRRALSTALSRRSLLALGGAGLGAALLGACGPSVGGPTGADPAAATDWAKVKPADKIIFMTTFTANEVEKAFVQEFSKESGITVEHVSGGGSYEDMAQAFRASAGTSEQPDVAMGSDVFWFQYLMTGNIIALDGLLEHLNVDTNDFQGALYGDYTYGGQHYAVPYGRSTPMFYYNKDVWEKAGLPDRGPKTWTEFTEWAPQLRTVLPKEGAPLGWDKPAPSGTAWVAQNMLWSFGANYSQEWKWTLDTPEAIKVGNLYRDSLNGADKWAKIATNGANEFTAGQYGAIVGSTGGIVTYRQQLPSLGVAFMPGGTIADDAPRVPTGGNGLTVSAPTPERQLAAGMLLEFLTRPENSARWALATGYMPTRKAALETERMKAGIAEVPDRQLPIDQLAITKVQDYARALLPGGDLLITEHWERIMLSGENPEDVFPQLTAEFDRAYKQSVEPNLGNI